MVSARLAVLALAAASIFDGVLAQPVVNRRHMNKHAQGEVVVKRHNGPVVKVYVVVDQYGNTIKHETKTEYPDVPPQTYAPAPAPVSTTPPVPPVPKKTKAKAPKKTKTKSKPKNTPKPAPQGTIPDASKLGKGVTYGPFHDDQSCKDKSTVISEMKTVYSPANGFNWVRIYGTSCNQVENVVCGAYETNIKVMLGVYNLDSPDAFYEELNALIAGVKSANKQHGRAEDDWSQIALVAIGNEVVQSHGGDGYWASESVKYAGIAREVLRKAGYKGSVTNSDVWYLYLKYPALCGEDEIVAINMHPFFDTNCNVNTSGQFLKDKLAEVQAVCGPSKKVIIAETGWPNYGAKPFANNVPGKAEQNTFLGLAAANLETYMLFSSFDEGWKFENTDSKVEKHWGILGPSPSN